MDRKALTSVIQGSIASILTALVTFKVLEADKASALAGVAVSLAPLVAAVAIRSARKPKQ
jgi:uncharacterized MnhB-related membrane protein